MRHIGQSALILALSLTGCGILESNNVESNGEVLELEFQLERNEETGFLSVSPRIRNRGTMPVTILKPDPCIQDLLVHRSEEFKSEVIWSRRETVSGCILKAFADIQIGPGMDAAVPLGTGIPFGSIPDEVIPAGRHAISYEWPVVLVHAGKESADTLQARVGIIEVSTESN
ncbi:MAG: hypothetical protein ACE5GJ_03670 [Gemmatimonadota bacterium]